MTISAEHPRAILFNNPIYFCALGFGSGCAPWAPGTFGTVAALPLYWLAADLPLLWFVVLTLLMFGIGVYICDRTARDLGVHDHPAIVWDEIVGYFITMIAAPFGWRWMLVGFLLFRVFDIIKPWPIRWVDQRVVGGFGIMFDDVLAGIYAWLILQALAIWIF